MDIIAPYICDIFNYIFDSGVFPDSWSDGLKIPLHKKGSKNDPNNYRGITLLSVLAKLFTTVLNKRINIYCDEHKSVSDAQFGFRKGQSTTDAMFVLHSVVQHFLNKNKRLYVGFIDLKKCFDGIYRNGLWLKMYQAGITSKMLRIIKTMYNKVRSCINQVNSFSDFFDCAIGLRQGEIISPVLVSLF